MLSNPYAQGHGRTVIIGLGFFLCYALGESTAKGRIGTIMAIDLNLGDTQIILRECHRHSLTVQQTAYVMATAFWESARTVKPVKEAYWVKGAEKWRKENLRYYPWYGRGYVQLTWEANYIKAGKKLGLDLTTNPDAVMEPNVSAKILVVGSMDGWFTGKKLGDYINASKVDYKSARRVINGTDRSADIAEIAKQYEKAIGKAPYKEPANPNPFAAFIAALLAIFGAKK